MDPYDSDSSGIEDGDYTETGVLLGYASKEPTDDAISHLGGHPTWLDASSPPPASLAKCKVCNDFMSLLLHLNGDLPEHFPEDERRLYILACRRRTCTRRNGSIKAFRSIRRHQSQRKPKVSSAVELQKPPERLGDSIFGVKSMSQSTSNANPFTSAPSPNADMNPFSTMGPFSSLAAKAPQKPEDSLPMTFAEKARISLPAAQSESQPAPDIWPQESTFPSPYPLYHLDADYETISRPSTPAPNVPANAQISSIDEDDTSSASIKDSFESSLDKPFMRFSTRLAHNPEQVIRYEFKGKPLLYSTSDAVGRLLAPRSNTGVNVSSGIPRCTNCGSARVFEVQLVPHAITMLEEDEQGVGLGAGGMEWGTVILGVCGKDCPEKGKETGEVGYVEEWAGVQWEEQMSKK